MAFALTRRKFWTALKRSCRGCRPKLAFGLCLFEEGYSLKLFGYFIPLLFLDRWAREPHEIVESWGVSLFERSIHVTWGSRYKFIRFPWDWEHLKHDVRRPDGTWVPYVSSWETSPAHGKEPDGRWEETYPYTYRLKSGEVQHRLATVNVERREWRWRWLMFSPWPAIKRQSINVNFDAEVGERTGSWKGGVMGTGHTMLPGETPLETLRRMEREETM